MPRKYKPKEREIKNCPICNKQFSRIKDDRRKRFCSDYCRWKHWDNNNERVKAGEVKITKEEYDEYQRLRAIANQGSNNN